MSIVSSLFQVILCDYSHLSVYGDQDSEVFQVLTEREILVLSYHSVSFWPRAGVLVEIPSINKPSLYLKTAKAGKENREADA